MRNYKWCMTCDGDGSTGGRVCENCGGRGYISQKQIQRDVDAAAALQLTVDETLKRIASDTKRGNGQA